MTLTSVSTTRIIPLDHEAFGTLQIGWVKVDVQPLGIDKFYKYYYKSFHIATNKYEQTNSYEQTNRLYLSQHQSPSFHQQPG